MALREPTPDFRLRELTLVGAISVEVIARVPVTATGEWLSISVLLPHCVASESKCNVCVAFGNKLYNSFVRV